MKLKKIFLFTVLMIGQVVASDELTPEFCLSNIQRRDVSGNASQWIAGFGSATFYGAGLASGYTTAALTYDYMKQGMTGEGLGTMFVGGMITAFFMYEGNEMREVSKVNEKRAKQTGTLLDLASYLGFLKEDKKADPKKGEKLFLSVAKFVQAQDSRISAEEVKASLAQQFFKSNCGYFFKKNLVYKANEYFMGNSSEEMGMFILSEKSLEYFKAQTAVEDSQREQEKIKKNEEEQASSANKESAQER